MGTPHGLTAAERFWMKVDKTDTCWLWTAAISDGYGVFGPRPGKSGKAHRFSYELHVGPIPSGLQLDHLCRVRHCVNPDHLEPVTQAENVRRGWAARGGRSIARGTRIQRPAPTPARRTPEEAGRALAELAPPITDAQALEIARLILADAA